MARAVKMPSYRSPMGNRATFSPRLRREGDISARPRLNNEASEPKPGRIEQTT